MNEETLNTLVEKSRQPQGLIITGEMTQGISFQAIAKTRETIHKEVSTGVLQLLKEGQNQYPGVSTSNTVMLEPDPDEPFDVDQEEGVEIYGLLFRLRLNGAQNAILVEGFMLDNSEQGFDRISKHVMQTVVDDLEQTFGTYMKVRFTTK